MKKKIYFFVVLPLLFLAVHMGAILITGMSVYPKLTECRFTGKPVYVWNAKWVDYHVRLNDEDTDVYVDGVGAYEVRISGYVRKSYDGPFFIDIKISTDELGNPSITINKFMPKEAINFLILTDEEKKKLFDALLI